LMTSTAGTGQEPLIIVGVVVAYLVAVTMSAPSAESASAHDAGRAQAAAEAGAAAPAAAREPAV